MLAALGAEPALHEAAQRAAKLRVPQDLEALEPKALARLDARYTLSGCVTAAAAAADAPQGAGAAAGGRWLVEGHDQVADTFGLLALEVDQAAARHKEPSDKVGALCCRGVVCGARLQLGCPVRPCQSAACMWARHAPVFCCVRAAPLWQVAAVCSGSQFHQM